ncbi:MAG: multiheme c-type cytochrome [bacterium]
MIVIIIFFSHVLWATEKHNNINDHFDAINDNVIEMDELTVEGGAEKPLEIYIIPRADLQLEVELNDSLIKEFTFNEINQKMLPQVPVSLTHDSIRKDSRKNKQVDHIEQKANCVSCHYQIDYTPLSHPPDIAKKINTTCITCHETEYHNISLNEMRDMLSVYIENKNIISRRDGKITFDKNFLCNKCHELNTIIFRESYSAKRPDETWNQDIMCYICHINYISKEK